MPQNGQICDCVNGVSIHSAREAAFNQRGGTGTARDSACSCFCISQHIANGLFACGSKRGMVTAQNSGVVAPDLRGREVVATLINIVTNCGGGIGIE